MNKNISIIIILLFLGISAAANDGSYDTNGRGGGSLIPVKNNAITMEKEKILIDVHRRSEYLFEVMYDCTFYFKNTTDAEQYVTIGFPHHLNAHMGPDYKRGGPDFVRSLTAPVVENFTFIISGNSANFKAFRAETNEAMDDVPAYDVVYAVEVVFKPGEKKTIRNTFSMPRRHDEWPYGGTWRRDEPMNFFNYILKTGLTWKEPIGQSDIIITFHVPPDTFNVELTPPGFIASADPVRFAYQYKDFVPESDIHVSFAFKKPSAEQIEKRARKYLDSGDDESAYYLLRQWDVTTLKDKKTKKVKDTVRNLAFKLAEKYFRKDPDKAINLYLIAARHAYSYDPGKDTPVFVNIYDYSAPSVPFVKWESEGETNAPCYYVFYNIGSLCAIQGEIDEANMWLNLAGIINPELSELALKDMDYDNLRYRDNPLISALKSQENIKLDKIDSLVRKEYINEHDLSGMTPLMCCIRRFGLAGEHIDELTLCGKLLEKGADVNAKDKSGKTALHHACENSEYKNISKVMELLIKKGADAHALDNNGDIPLSLAFIKADSVHPDVFAVIRNTKNLNMPNHEGITPLMYAVNNICGTDIIKLLLDNGADPNLADNSGMNSLHYVCWGKLFCDPDERIKLVLPLINDIARQDKYGKTAFHYLCNNPFFNDASLFSDDEDKRKELQKAKEVIKYFLDNKVDASITDYCGSYALDALPKELRLW